jgi:hypothetical protein
MGNGFFLGGMAEGMADSRRQSLAEQTQTQDVGLRSRALDLQERTIRNSENVKASEVADKHIADTMGIVAETIKAGIAGGTSPDKLLMTVSPLLDSAKQLAARAGRNPAALDAQVKALVSNPTVAATAATAGSARAAGEIAYDATMTAAENARGVGTDGGPVSRIRDPKQRMEAEGKIYDDYRQNPVVTEFAEVAGAKTRLDSLPNSDAGNIALLHNYMRITNPKVRMSEEDVATAAQNGVLPKPLQSAYNAMSGKNVALAKQARDQLKEAANSAYEAQAGRYDTARKGFEERAKRFGLNPKNVVGMDLRAPKADGFDSRFGDIPPPPKGFVLNK